MKNIVSKKRTTRAISVVTILIFFATSIDGAWALSALEPVEFNGSGTQTVRGINSSPSLPENLGSLSRFSWKEGAGFDPEHLPERFVVFVQDAHGNFEAQQSAEAILRHYREAWDVRTILAEGGAGEADIRALRSVSHPEIVREVADEFLKDARLAGFEHEALTGPADYRLLGLESPVLYRKNLDAFRRVSVVREENERIIRTLKKEISEAKKKVFGKALYALDRKLGEEAPVDRRILYLARRARELGVDFDRLETLRLFLRAHVLGSLLEIPWLEQKSGDRLRYENKLKELLASFDPERLSAEEEALTHAVKEKLIRTEEERALDQKARAVFLLGKLVRLELSSREWTEYQRRVGVDRRVDPMNGQAGEHAGSPLHVKPAEMFYRLASARDRSLARNLIRRLGDEKHAFLITGGFHAPALERALTRVGISFLSITPRIGEHTSPRLYLKRMEEATARHTLMPPLETFHPVAFQREVAARIENRYGIPAKEIAPAVAGFGSDTDTLRDEPAIPAARKKEIESRALSMVDSFWVRLERLADVRYGSHGKLRDAPAFKAVMTLNFFQRTTTDDRRNIPHVESLLAMAQFFKLEIDEMLGTVSLRGTVSEGWWALSLPRRVALKMKETGLTDEQLSRVTGLSKNHLRHFISDSVEHHYLYSMNAILVALALGISPGQLIENRPLEMPAPRPPAKQKGARWTADELDERAWEAVARLADHIRRRYGNPETFTETVRDHYFTHPVLDPRHFSGDLFPTAGEALFAAKAHMYFMDEYLGTEDLRGDLGRYPDYPKTFSTRLKYLLQAKGWSVEQFAERALVSVPVIKEALLRENDFSNPMSLDRLMRIAGAFGLSPGQLIEEPAVPDGLSAGFGADAVGNVTIYKPPSTPDLTTGSVLEKEGRIQAAFEERLLHWIKKGLASESAGLEDLRRLLQNKYRINKPHLLKPTARILILESDLSHVGIDDLLGTVALRAKELPADWANLGLGRRIALMRKEKKNSSLEEISQLTGLSVAALKYSEQNENTTFMRFPTVLRLSLALGISPEQLLRGLAVPLPVEPSTEPSVSAEVVEKPVEVKLEPFFEELGEEMFGLFYPESESGPPVSAVSFRASTGRLVKMTSDPISLPEERPEITLQTEDGFRLSEILLTRSGDRTGSEEERLLMAKYRFRAMEIVTSLGLLVPDLSVGAGTLQGTLAEYLLSDGPYELLVTTDADQKTFSLVITETGHLPAVITDTGHFPAVITPTGRLPAVKAKPPSLLKQKKTNRAVSFILRHTDVDEQTFLKTLWSLAEHRLKRKRLPIEILVLALGLDDPAWPPLTNSSREVGAITIDEINRILLERSRIPKKLSRMMMFRMAEEGLFILLDELTANKERARDIIHQATAAELMGTFFEGRLGERSKKTAAIAKKVNDTQALFGSELDRLARTQYGTRRRFRAAFRETTGRKVSAAHFYTPSVETLLALASFLKVGVDDLLGTKKVIPPPPRRSVVRISGSLRFRPFLRLAFTQGVSPGQLIESLPEVAIPTTGKGFGAKKPGRKKRPERTPEEEREQLDRMRNIIDQIRRGEGELIQPKVSAARDIERGRALQKLERLAEEMHAAFYLSQEEHHDEERIHPDRVVFNAVTGQIVAYRKEAVSVVGRVFPLALRTADQYWMSSIILKRAENRTSAHKSTQPSYEVSHLIGLFKRVFNGAGAESINELSDVLLYGEHVEINNAERTFAIVIEETGDLSGTGFGAEERPNSPERSANAKADAKKIIQAFGDRLLERATKQFSSWPNFVAELSRAFESERIYRSDRVRHPSVTMLIKEAQFFDMGIDELLGSEAYRRGLPETWNRLDLAGRIGIKLEEYGWDVERLMHESGARQKSIHAYLDKNTLLDADLLDVTRLSLALRISPGQLLEGISFPMNRGTFLWRRMASTPRTDLDARIKAARQKMVGDIKVRYGSAKKFVEQYNAGAVNGMPLDARAYSGRRMPNGNDIFRAARFHLLTVDEFLGTEDDQIDISKFPDYPVGFSERFEYWLTLSDLSPAAFSELADVKFSVIADALQKKAGPLTRFDLDTLMRIALTFGVSVGQLIDVPGADGLRIAPRASEPTASASTAPVRGFGSDSLEEIQKQDAQVASDLLEGKRIRLDELKVGVVVLKPQDMVAFSHIHIRAASSDGRYTEEATLQLHGADSAGPIISVAAKKMIQKIADSNGEPQVYEGEGILRPHDQWYLSLDAHPRRFKFFSMVWHENGRLRITRGRVGTRFSDLKRGPIEVWATKRSGFGARAGKMTEEEKDKWRKQAQVLLARIRQAGSRAALRDVMAFQAHIRALVFFAIQRNNVHRIEGVGKISSIVDEIVPLVSARVIREYDESKTRLSTTVINLATRELGRLLAEAGVTSRAMQASKKNKSRPRKVGAVDIEEMGAEAYGRRDRERSAMEPVVKLSPERKRRDRTILFLFKQAGADPEKLSSAFAYLVRPRTGKRQKLQMEAVRLMLGLDKMHRLFSVDDPYRPFKVMKADEISEVFMARGQTARRYSAEAIFQLADQGLTLLLIRLSGSEAKAREIIRTAPAVELSDTFFERLAHRWNGRESHLDQKIDAAAAELKRQIRPRIKKQYADLDHFVKILRRQTGKSVKKDKIYQPDPELLMAMASALEANVDDLLGTASGRSRTIPSDWAALDLNAKVARIVQDRGASWSDVVRQSGLHWKTSAGSTAGAGETAPVVIPRSLRFEPFLRLAFALGVSPGQLLEGATFPPLSARTKPAKPLRTAPDALRSTGFGTASAVVYDIETERAVILGELLRLGEQKLDELDKTLRYGIAPDLFEMLPSVKNMRHFLREDPQQMRQDEILYYRGARVYIRDNVNTQSQAQIAANLNKLIFFTYPEIPVWGLSPFAVLTHRIPSAVRRTLDMNFAKPIQIPIYFSKQRIPLAAVQIMRPEMLGAVLELIEEVRTVPRDENGLPIRRGKEYLRRGIRDALTARGNQRHWKVFFDRLRFLLQYGVHPDLADEVYVKQDVRRLRDFLIQSMDVKDRNMNFPVYGKGLADRESDNRKYLFFRPADDEDIQNLQYVHYEYYENLLGGEKIAKLLAEYLGFDIADRHLAATHTEPEIITGIAMNHPEFVGDVLLLITEAEKAIREKRSEEEKVVWDREKENVRHDLTRLREDKFLYGMLFNTLRSGAHPDFHPSVGKFERSRFIADVVEEDRKKFDTAEPDFYERYFFFPPLENGRTWLPRQDESGKFHYGGVIPKSVERILGIRPDHGADWFTADLLSRSGRHGRTVRKPAHVVRVEYLENVSRLLGLFEEISKPGVSRIPVGFGAAPEDLRVQDERAIKDLLEGRSVKLDFLHSETLVIRPDDLKKFSKIRIRAKSVGGAEEETAVFTPKVNEHQELRLKVVYKKIVRSSEGKVMQKDGGATIRPDNKWHRSDRDTGRLSFFSFVWHDDKRLRIAGRSQDDYSKNENMREYIEISAIPRQGFGVAQSETAASIIIPDAEEMIRSGELTAEAIRKASEENPAARIHLVFAGRESWEEAAQFIEAAFGTDAKTIFPRVRIYTAAGIRQKARIALSASASRLSGIATSYLVSESGEHSVVIGSLDETAPNLRKARYLLREAREREVHGQLLENALFLAGLGSAEAIKEATDRGLRRLDNDRWLDTLTNRPSDVVLEQMVAARAFDVAA